MKSRYTFVALAVGLVLLVAGAVVAQDSTIYWRVQSGNTFLQNKVHVGETLGVTGVMTTTAPAALSGGVNIGGGGAITMVKATSLDFLTSAAATVVPLAGVLPGDTIMAMPNSTATEPLISVVPSTGTLTFTWDGDNATTLTVGVIVLR